MNLYISSSTNYVPNTFNLENLEIEIVVSLIKD